MTTPTMQAEKRLKVIQRVFRSELTVMQAALLMGLSERQCYRVKARVGKAEAKGVVHGNRRRPVSARSRRRPLADVAWMACSFRSLRNLSIAPTPIRELTCMCFWTARWSFLQKRKNGAFDLKKRMHLAHSERTRSGKVALWTYFQSINP
jgi:hypothetical protein